MTTTMQTNEAAYRIAADVRHKLTKSLSTLEKGLSRVETDLSLGCRNLQDLVNSRNPHVNKQLAMLQEGVTELHERLAEVRSHLAEARGDTIELKEVLPDNSGEPARKPGRDHEGHFDQKLAARMRHDEPVTLGGILRALLMADAPEQRMS